MRPALPFSAPWLLAPMEGVTEPCFRDLVLARNGPDALGGAFTEFVRVVRQPLPQRSLRAQLAGRSLGRPVGLQLMGSEREATAESARRAAEVGAPLVDLNFGCPAKGALAGCAGSAFLRDPAALEAMVQACARALEDRVPLSAKIRAGFDDDSRLEELARAAEAGGASFLTVHCRTRAEHYTPEVDWSRIARAVGAVSIPVCGNGGVREPADLERMRAETGCAFAMAGRAALGDPWVFRRAAALARGETDLGPSAADAARFLLDYAALLGTRAGASERGAAGRVKQLLAHWSAGGLAEGEERARWLREREPSRLLARLAESAGVERDPRWNPLPECESEVASEDGETPSCAAVRVRSFPPRPSRHCGGARGDSTLPPSLRAPAAPASLEP